MPKWNTVLEQYVLEVLQGGEEVAAVGFREAPTGLIFIPLGDTPKTRWERLLGVLARLDETSCVGLAASVLRKHDTKESGGPVEESLVVVAGVERATRRYRGCAYQYRLNPDIPAGTPGHVYDIQELPATRDSLTTGYLGPVMQHWGIHAPEVGA